MILLYAAPAVATLVLCLSASYIGRGLGVFDYPDGARKVHRRETPLVGGIAVILPLAAITLILAVSGDFAPLYWVLAASMLGFLILGLLDDRRHLRPAMRLGVSAISFLGFLWIVPDLDVTFLKFSFRPHATCFSPDPPGRPLRRGEIMFSSGPFRGLRAVGSGGVG